MADKHTALHKGFRVFKALRGHTLSGMSNQELCRATGLNASAVTRIMQALIDEGLAEKRSDGRFALSVSTLQIAQAHALEIQRAQDRINELGHRISTGLQ